MRRHTALTIIEVVAATAVVALACVMLMVIGSLFPQSHPRPDSSLRLRAIHQTMETYANSNNGWYPGLDSQGQIDTQPLDLFRDLDGPSFVDELAMRAGITVEQRFAVMLDASLFTPDYLIAPRETDPAIDGWPGKGPFITRHFLYALLQLPKSGGRREAWGSRLNTKSIIATDRNTGTLGQPSSVHDEESWTGNVVWGDGHAGYEETDTFETQFGSGQTNAKDKLFIAEGDDDALLIHSGN